MNTEKNSLTASDIRSNVDLFFGLFDKSRGYKLVSTDRRRSLDGKSDLAELIGEDMLARLSEELERYNNMPILAGNDKGCALFCNDLLPSTSLLLTVFLPSVPFDKLGGYCRQYMSDKLFVLDDREAAESVHMRKTAKLLEYDELLNKVINVMKLSFGESEGDSIDVWLPEKLLAISEVLGGALKYAGGASLPVSREFDSRMCMAFIIALSIDMLEKGRNVSAIIGAEKVEWGVLVKCDCMGSECDPASFPLTSAVINAATRKNMFADIERADGRICFKLVPVIRDWSYIELKQD